MTIYEVVIKTPEGKVQTLAGCGKNKGTWDADHSRSAAYRHAKAYRAEHPELTVKVVRQFEEIKW